MRTRHCVLVLAALLTLQSTPMWAQTTARPLPAVDRRPPACPSQPDARFWSLTGNAGTDPDINFLGTRDNEALVLRVNCAPALQLEPNPLSPNIIGGVADNSVAAGVGGATIAGGGTAGGPNQVTADFATG